MVGMEGGAAVGRAEDVVGVRRTSNFWRWRCVTWAGGAVVSRGKIPWTACNGGVTLEYLENYADLSRSGTMQSWSCEARSFCCLHSASICCR